MIKKAAAILMLLALFCVSGCANDDSGKLTLDVIRGMAREKGEELTWRDFERYPSTETGSGLYILVYEIDKKYDLMIGGVPDEKPMYIYLTVADDFDQRIDIRYDDIDDFLTRTKG